MILMFEVKYMQMYSVYVWYVALYRFDTSHLFSSILFLLLYIYE